MQHLKKIKYFYFQERPLWRCFQLVRGFIITGARSVNMAASLLKKLATNPVLLNNAVQRLQFVRLAGRK